MTYVPIGPGLVDVMNRVDLRLLHGREDKTRRFRVLEAFVGPDGMRIQFLTKGRFLDKPVWVDTLAMFPIEGDDLRDIYVPVDFEAHAKRDYPIRRYLPLHSALYLAGCDIPTPMYLKLHESAFPYYAKDKITVTMYNEFGHIGR